MEDDREPEMGGWGDEQFRRNGRGSGEGKQGAGAAASNGGCGDERRKGWDVGSPTGGSGVGEEGLRSSAASFTYASRAHAHSRRTELQHGSGVAPPDRGALHSLHRFSIPLRVVRRSREGLSALCFVDCGRLVALGSLPPRSSLCSPFFFGSWPPAAVGSTRRRCVAMWYAGQTHPERFGESRSLSLTRTTFQFSHARTPPHAATGKVDTGEDDGGRAGLVPAPGTVLGPWR